MNKTTSSDHVDLELFFNSANDLFCVAGFDGFFKKVNPAVCKALGYSAQELIAKPIDYFIHPDDRMSTQERRLKLQESVPLKNFENRYITRTGEIIWLSWNSVSNLDLKQVFAVAKDITARKTAEIKRNNTELQAQEFMYTALHDFRSPVNNMVAILDLYDDLSQPPASQQESLDMLKASISDLKSKMELYLDRFVNNSHHQPVLNQPQVLNDSLERVKKQLSALLIQTGASVHADFTSADELFFDAEYLDSIFLNLLSNSLKYARPGVPPEINIQSRNLQEFLEITMKDNGLGFSQKESEDKIFGFQQRLHQVNDGKGIGLYLVKRHLNRSGGDIQVSSVPGKGTAFTIRFKKRSV